MEQDNRGRFKLAVFDLDGTLTREPSLWEYIHVRLGSWTGQADRYLADFLAGRIDYETFCRLDARVWRGRTLEELSGLARAVPFHQGVGRLTGHIRNQGLHLVLISSGLTLLSDWVAERYGFDIAVANELEFDRGRATGEVRIRVHFDQKREWLARAMETFGASPGEVLAFGDSDGDRHLFDLAGYRVAVNPRSRKLADRADLVHRGPDLSVLIPRLPL
ncbi:MAG: HAD family phosphatase [Proteobacteria bacterium]|nr:HAD family phosphatase [Pseudomonadota bacterium]